MTSFPISGAGRRLLLTAVWGAVGVLSIGVPPARSADGNEQAAAQDGPAASCRSGGYILDVSDDQQGAGILQRALRSVGYEEIPSCPSPCPPYSMPGGQGTEGSMPDSSGDMSSAQASTASAGGAAALASLPGYIDDAVIRSRVRVRYDNIRDTQFPDRAEFWAPSVTQLTGGRAGGNLPFAGPGIQPGSNTPVSYQEIQTYVEVACTPWFSVFGEFPIRFNLRPVIAFDPIAGQQDDDQGGAGDVSLGLRLALWACGDDYLTLQVRGTAPTGDPTRWLGTGHSSIEVGLLFSCRASDRVSIFGEIKEWEAIRAAKVGEFGGSSIPLADPDNAAFIGQSFGGSVLTYGLGLGYDLYQGCCPCCCDCRCGHAPRLTALFEVVGWSVLDGLKTDLGTSGFINDVRILDASGDFILNGKYGLRYTSGHNTFYGGFGHNWTDEKWYGQIYRFEYSYLF